MIAKYWKQQNVITELCSCTLRAGHKPLHNRFDSCSFICNSNSTSYVIITTSNTRRESKEQRFQKLKLIIVYLINVNKISTKSKSLYKYIDLKLTNMFLDITTVSIY